MRRMFNVLANLSFVALLPVASNAAGTYYNGSTYQSPQRNYANISSYQSQQRSTYNSKYDRSKAMSMYGTKKTLKYANKPLKKQNDRGQQVLNIPSDDKKFSLNVGFLHEFAMWGFDMNETGSKLHYDNLGWNVFDVQAVYKFGNSTPMQFNAGFKYGVQSGESTMVDDDISEGGYINYAIGDEDNGIVGYSLGHAMSIGTTKGGREYGFNAGLGFTDAFTIGKAKFTPSIGYRYLNYKLSTEKNYGIAIDTFSEGAFYDAAEQKWYATGVDANGELQYDPLILIYNSVAESEVLTGRIIDGDGNIANFISGGDLIDVGGTYYYEQSGTSHEYEVVWHGPYIALDMDYSIDLNNSINARLELGLPMYQSEGNQPYRYDWDHPKSVEDKAGFGNAYHFGTGLNWLTALTDTVDLSVGFTFDYYKANKADATTYLNANLYNEMYEADSKFIETYPDHPEYYLGITEEQVAAIMSEFNSLEELQAECPGWVCKQTKEVNSIYKSMGIRVGINAKF